MDALRQYLVGVVAVTLICSIITQLLQGSGCRDGIRILCGVFLTLVLIQPIHTIPDLELQSRLSQWEDAAQAIAEDGKSAAQKKKETIIKQQTEAYIINKAAEANAEVAAEVTIGEDGIPVAAAITGSISPAVKQQLIDILTEELGIPEAGLKWNG